MCLLKLLNSLQLTRIHYEHGRISTVLHFDVRNRIRVVRFKEFDISTVGTAATEESVQALADKLYKELETQLAQAQANPLPITVKVLRERKLRKFAGLPDERLLADWILATPNDRYWDNPTAML